MLLQLMFKFRKSTRQKLQPVRGCEEPFSPGVSKNANFVQPLKPKVSQASTDIIYRTLCLSAISRFILKVSETVWGTNIQQWHLKVIHRQSPRWYFLNILPLDCTSSSSLRISLQNAIANCFFGLSYWTCAVSLGFIWFGRDIVRMK